jgi:hypothetical protein
MPKPLQDQPPKPAISAPTIQIPKEPSAANQATIPASPQTAAPQTAASNAQPAATPLSAPKPNEADDDGSVKPIRLNAPGLSDTGAPLLKPVSTSTLVDGKIVINKP